MPATGILSGWYTFPGAFAFLATPASLQPVLLQFDVPFTGQFNAGAAAQTKQNLQARFQEGDSGQVTGVLQDRDVEGMVRPVLFFSSATGAPAQTAAAPAWAVVRP